MNEQNTGYGDRVHGTEPGTQANQNRQYVDEKVVPFTLTPDEISALAAQDDKPNADMTTIDWLLWYMLRDVYRDFKHGHITKEQGAERKRQALDIWERQTDRYHADRDLINRVVALWKNVEAAASTYRKDRTLENADAIMTAIYGMRRGGASEQADRAGRGGCDTASEGGVQWQEV